MSKISSLGGMMQMMCPTEDDVDRKRCTICYLTFHCVGKVTTGFLTSKKEGLFFWVSNDDQKIPVGSFSSLTLKISHLSKFDSFLGQ